jgi:hypothetical protein
MTVLVGLEMVNKNIIGCDDSSVDYFRNTCLIKTYFVFFFSYDIHLLL